ncbi:antibiotic biosynthesis monooxygenase [Kaistia algarum]|uniref:antibiotic biosynthesis monooxygenase n=1 Tax=Kaistia algarum TaxID=2083279 RepID=UPI000CE7D214|nr:antibiotic biosynthesis monooxygenase [Kaistia algarum]MCX5516719.1 antibiotic biosynthesis monooxygenase [Kaistia algarum]PPE78610.1 antibiotic biosynthesis monooxygenase [Kaistia algarum]
MSLKSQVPDQPVALVIQQRIADEGYAAFTHWTGGVAEALKLWPGFLGLEVVAPRPPAQLDWVQIIEFATPAAARGWLHSDVRARLVEDIQRFAAGPEDVHLLPEAGGHRAEAVSAVISFNVPPDEEVEFLAWQASIQAAEAEFRGFLRHKIERPIPGLHDDWVIVLSFDTDANLSAWMDSPQREALLQVGRQFNTGLAVKRASYGFNFWFPAGQPADQTPSFIFKSNLIVLLVLYPVVFLWGYFISKPFIDVHGVPFWLSLFIGNVASTQFLGWWIAPAAFKRLEWWLQPDPGLRRNLLGYCLLAVLYGLSMALYAGLIAWNWGHG